MKKLLTVFLVLIMLLNNITVIADDLIDNTNETPVMETTTEEVEEVTKEEEEEVPSDEETVPYQEEEQEASEVEEQKEEVVEETTKEEITVKKEEIVEEKKVEEKTITSTPKAKLKAAPSRSMPQYPEIFINIYVGNTLKDSFNYMTHGDVMPKEFTDIYGELINQSATVNGQNGFAFNWGTIVIVDQTFSPPQFGDEIVLNLYFKASEEPEQVEYGTVELSFTDQFNKPVAGYEVTFTGQPGNVTVTGTSNEEGKLIINGEQLDVKLSWSYQINGYTYELAFDEDNYCEYTFTITVEEEPVETDINGKINVYVNNGKTDEEDILNKNGIDTIKKGTIKYTFNHTDTHEFDKGTITLNGENEKQVTYEGNNTFKFEGYPDIKVGDTVEVNLYFKNKVQKEFTINVEHQFNVKPITVTDGYSDSEDSVLFQGKKITVKAGDEITYNDLMTPVNNEFTIVDDKTVLYNGDLYAVSGKFAEGGSSNAFVGSVHDLDLTRGSTFVMPNTDIHIIENYLLIKPEYKVTINYIDMETNELFSEDNWFIYPDGSKQKHTNPVVKEFEGSTNALGKKEYDVTEYSKSGKWFRAYPDYEFVKAEGEFTGEMNEDKVINMYYKKLEGKVIVHYIDIEDNTLLDDVILTGKVGETYLTEEKTIENFELVKVEGDYTGTYTKEDIEVTYIYTAIGTGGEEVPEEPNNNPQTIDNINTSIVTLILSTYVLVSSLYFTKKAMVKVNR